MKAALLVVDVQRVYVDELESERRAAFLRTPAKLIERARAYGTPVIFVRDVGDADGTRARSDDLEIATEIAPRSGKPVTLVEDGHVTLPAGGLTEEQIRGHVHRVVRGRIASIVPAVDVAFLSTQMRDYFSCAHASANWRVPVASFASTT